MPIFLFSFRIHQKGIFVFNLILVSTESCQNSLETIRTIFLHKMFAESTTSNSIVKANVNNISAPQMNGNLFVSSNVDDKDPLDLEHFFFFLFFFSS